MLVPMSASPVSRKTSRETGRNWSATRDKRDRFAGQCCCRHVSMTRHVLLDCANVRTGQLPEPVQGQQQADWAELSGPPQLARSHTKARLSLSCADRTAPGGNAGAGAGGVCRTIDATTAWLATGVQSSVRTPALHTAPSVLADRVISEACTKFLILQACRVCHFIIS